MSSPTRVTVFVTGVGSRKTAREAEAIIRAYVDVPRFAELLDVDVAYYCSTAEDIDQSGVSEYDWLVRNACTGEFAVHIRHEDISRVRAKTFARIAEEIERHRAGSACSVESMPGASAMFHRPPLDEASARDRRLLRYMCPFTARKPRLALLVVMTKRGLQEPKSLPICSTLAASMTNTLIVDKYIEHALYLGVDDDETLTTHEMQVIQNRFGHSSLRTPLVHVERFPVEWRSSEFNMSKMYNALFRRAIMDGCDFAIQLQDDIRLEYAGWDRLMASHLAKNPLAVGAYSTQDTYEPTRYDTVMVSRTHFDIFGYMFNERVPDSSVWVSCLGRYVKIVEQCKSVNTIRRWRRGMNGTSRVYLLRGEGGDSEECVRDREYYLKRVEEATELAYMM